jgi:uncharacterized protein YggE
MFKVSRLHIGIILILIILGSACLESQTNVKPDLTPQTSGEQQSAEVVSSLDFRSPNLGGADVDSDRGIVVNGQGRITVVPDIAVFTVGVENTGRTPAQALSENSRAMSSVVEAIKSSGVLEKDVKTQAVNVWPEYDYGKPEEKRELPEILGYRAENRVTVTIRNIEDVATIMDAAISAGANRLYGLSFTVDEERSKSLKEQVLKAAVLDAVDKAQAIADAIDIKRISPVKVVEGVAYSPPVFRYDVAALEKAAPTTPISPGETEVVASVTVTFDFEL